MNPNSHPRFTNTLFTSLSQFTNSSSLFPTHDRRIGLTVTCGYHPEHKQVMVLVEEEQPSFISTSVGEYVEPGEAEVTVRKTCSTLAETCRRQAKELLEHAERLERLAKQSQPLIDPSKIDKDSDHESIIASQYQPVKRRVNNLHNSHIHKTLTNEPTTTSTTSNSRRSVALDMDDI